MATVAEEAAYRAGMVDSRLRALEAHADTVNGTIKSTGEALQAQTVAVNALHVTIKMLDLATLAHRVSDLEQDAKVNVSIIAFRRYLVGTAISLVLVTTGLVALVVKLSI